MIVSPILIYNNRAMLERSALPVLSLSTFLIACLFLVTTPVAATASRSGDWPVDVQHSMGMATITEQPSRVVSLYQGSSDTLAALGIEPVGMVESWTQQPVYDYLGERLGAPRMLGMETQPDLEGIAWLEPDLIVGVRYRHHGVYPLLSQIAPTVIAREVYDFRSLLTMLAHATGRQDKGRALLGQWDARVKDFRARIREKLGDQWPMEVAILSFRGDHARIYYQGFAKQVLQDLGFRAPADHRKDSWGIKLTSQESIPAMDADAIFIFMLDDPAVQRTFEDWTSHPLWQTLSAVRRDQVFQVDPVTWNMGAGIIAAHRLLDDLYDHYGLEDGVSEGCILC